VLGALPQRPKHSYASDAPIAEPAIFGEGMILTEDFDDYFPSRGTETDLFLQTQR
jgi:hypothetical protein